MDTAFDLANQIQAEALLRLQAAALGAAANAVIITERSGRIIWINPAFTAITGYSAEEVIGGYPRILKSGKHPRDFYERMWTTILAGQVWQGEMVNRRKDGSTYTEDQTITPIRNEQHEITHFVAIKQDVSENRLLAQQLHQAQKMESVGRLAGGVAHDFNNMLGVIIGYSELLEEQVDGNEELTHRTQEIKKAGHRAASLTRQLLAFSRQQLLEATVLNVNEIVCETAKMLRRIIGDEIELTTALSPMLAMVKADPGQIQQIIMNLAVNARDAMPHGGKVKIETANVDLDENFAKMHKPMIPGRYVKLSVVDTGTGMDPETQAHIFEPFFTTKDIGKGTGLGLATVYGVVKQSGGYIWVETSLGNGTTFDIYLPEIQEAGAPSIGSAPTVKTRWGSETILLVENLRPFRELTQQLLESRGYTVLAVGSGLEAIAIAEHYTGPIHMLLTDVAMVGMSGVELAKALSALRTGLKVLLMSAYFGSAVDSYQEIVPGATFLQKPFTREALSAKIHEALTIETDVENFIQLK
jgi:two-component system, cell cycle sensor histidine kinase and response regulator CckA